MNSRVDMSLKERYKQGTAVSSAFEESTVNAFSKQAQQSRCQFAKNRKTQASTSCRPMFDQSVSASSLLLVRPVLLLNLLPLLSIIPLLIVVSLIIL